MLKVQTKYATKIPAALNKAVNKLNKLVPEYNEIKKEYDNLCKIGDDMWDQLGLIPEYWEDMIFDLEKDMHTHYDKKEGVEYKMIVIRIKIENIEESIEEAHFQLTSDF